MVHFNIGSRHIQVQPRRSSINLDMPDAERPSMVELARMAVRMGIVTRAAQLGGRAAMMNPRLTASLVSRALPDMPWQRRSTMPWQSWSMPSVDRRNMPWQTWSMPSMGRRMMPWQSSRGLPWMAAAGVAWPWMRQRSRRMPWAGGWDLRLPRQRRDAAPQAWQLLLAAMAGGLMVYLLDPEQGNRRRKMAVQKINRMARVGAREVSRTGRRLSTTIAGKRQMLMYGSRWHEPLDDATLAHKVESVLFRDPQVPKGNINVNSEHGVVVLRGEVQTPDEIREIERRVRDIEGVQDVRTMLHLSTSAL